MLRWGDTKNLDRLCQRFSTELTKTTFGVELEMSVPVDRKKPDLGDLASFMCRQESIWLSQVREAKDAFQALKYNPHGLFDGSTQFQRFLERRWLPSLDAAAMNNLISSYQNLMSSEIADFSRSQQVIEDLRKLAEAHGFAVGGEFHSETEWGIGYDSYSASRPIIRFPESTTLVELRTGILEIKDLDRFVSWLTAWRSYLLGNPDIVLDGGCGAHVHIGNCLTKMGKDYFALLCGTAGMDEYKVITDSESRDFSKHAKLNEVLHDKIVSKIMYRYSASDLQDGVFITEGILCDIMNNLPDKKHHGVNTTTEHPTVEFRYLPSHVPFRNPKHFGQYILYYAVLALRGLTSKVLTMKACYHSNLIISKMGTCYELRLRPISYSNTEAYRQASTGLFLLSS